MDLSQIKLSYEHQGYDLNEMRRHYKVCHSARQFFEKKQRSR